MFVFYTLYINSILIHYYNLIISSEKKNKSKKRSEVDHTFPLFDIPPILPSILIQPIAKFGQSWTLVTCAAQIAWMTNEVTNSSGTLPTVPPGRTFDWFFIKKVWYVDQFQIIYYHQKIGTDPYHLFFPIFCFFTCKWKGLVLNFFVPCQFSKITTETSKLQTRPNTPSDIMILLEIDCYL